MEQLEKNEALRDSFSKIQSNSEEIHKLYESIVEIRRINIDDKHSSSMPDKDKKDIMIKISDLEINLKHLQNQFDDNIKGVDSIETEFSGLSFKLLTRFRLREDFVCACSETSVILVFFLALFFHPFF